VAPRRLTTDDDAASETITAADVGLPSGAAVPWRFVPETTLSPLVISFPHVGLAWSEDLGAVPPVDLGRNADYAVETMYREAIAEGGARIEAVYSRLIVDLNRAADDISPQIVPDHPAPRPRQRPGSPALVGAHGDADPLRPGRGVVWVKALGDVWLFTPPLPYAAFKDRIDRFHEPYYRAIEILLERRRRRFGYAVLLDAHSMPCSVGIDLVLGTLAGTSCAKAIERRALVALGSDLQGQPSHGRPSHSRHSHAPLRVRLNEPYHGGELVRRFGRPAEGLHALQLEVSRGLYMDEQSLALWQSPASDTPVRNAGVGPRRTAPPSNQHARDFSELQGRVSCLVRALGERVDPRMLAGTSSLAARVTSARGKDHDGDQISGLPLSPSASKR
jgi:N-formylglutamate amidohydrolase